MKLDLETMRQTAETIVEAERANILQRHPWFTEFKRICGDGLYERNLCDRIKEIIEDQLKFTGSIFSQLFRLIPEKEFCRDEIQRLILYIRQQEGLSEKEYMDAVEAAGHIYDQTIT